LGTPYWPSGIVNNQETWNQIVLCLCFLEASIPTDDDWHIDTDRFIPEPSVDPGIGLLDSIQVSSRKNGSNPVKRRNVAISLAQYEMDVITVLGYPSN
jgi:hypothetical protein